MIGTCRGDSEWRWDLPFCLLFPVTFIWHLFIGICSKLKWSLFSDRKREAAGCSKTKEGDGVRTLECLRGRLLAERQSSKVAKEAAELLANKVSEETIVSFSFKHFSHLGFFVLEFIDDMMLV